MSIRVKVVRGIKWTTLSTVSLTLTNLIKISVLARLLDKSDFGLMALVTFVLGFMNLFMDLGLSTAILHQQNISKKEYSSLFWTNIISGLILFIIIILISPILSSVYNEPELSKLIPLMSLSIIIAATGRQFKTIEQKKLNFKFIAITDISGSVFGVITGILLALQGAGVYSLVWGSLVHYIVSNSLLFKHGIRTNKPMFHYSFNETKTFLKIGMFQIGGQMVNYFNRDLDILLIGKIFGTDALGGYSLAKQFARRPMQILNPIIIRVASSVLPRYQKNDTKLRYLITDLLKSLGSIYALVYGAIAILSPHLVVIFFGKDLISITIYVQMFCVVQYFRAIGNSAGILVITKGRTDYDFYWNILVTLIMPVAVFLGSQVSIDFVIIMLGAVQLVLIIPVWYIFYYKLVRLNIKHYLKASLIPFGILVMVFGINEFLISRNLFVEILLCLFSTLLIGYYSYRTINEFQMFSDRIIFKIRNLT